MHETVKTAAIIEPVIDVFGAEHRPKLVLIPGWASLKQSLQGLAEQLSQHYCVYLFDLPGYGSNRHWHNDYQDQQQLAEQLLAQLPDQAVYIGWSLGGNIALSLAEHSPERVLAVATVATNLRFVASDDYPAAMAADTYQQFSQSLQANPASTLTLFQSLQLKGSPNERQWRRADRGHTQPPADQQTLQNSLAMLGRVDQRHCYQQLLMPKLSIFADADNLVPAAAAERLTDSVVLPGCHQLFRDSDEVLCQQLERFIQSLACCRSKQLMAQSFSRAADSYDASAQLQRDIADHLFSAIDGGLSLGAEAVVVDLGCGTGYISQRLSTTYPQARFIGVDIAEGMLDYARQHSGVGEAGQWLAADAEALPFADNSVDVMYSSLAIQWCQHLPRLFSEIRRVLKPGGRCYFSTLLDGTLTELKQAWAAVDDYVHVNQFDSNQHWLDCVEQAELSATHWQQQTITLQYQQLKQLTGELKAIGAHNVNSGRPDGLTGRQRVKALRARYECFRNQQGLLPATYRVLYAELLNRH
ncbi:2-methoxy-6-polyprenyl-1,4-benzoquinol methylase, mitochondrial [Sinobacterium norvegicum]|uniref:Malonyl-[acyl-carrier protein] O-methyltransferase n=1 Tax=Sinobacterium norvegicum TaxID=1641715 RepID=A0ABM9AFK1_9GAMM|nr:malonyl-ACP O-methyltransferase BioC [Sinobacterium norvegicum]CAH0991904.1 2-methoxy-6-polyprenyl-1,4-benzoquinol methylase, mitochondrial [Sinobacterium norvegicum]